MIVIIKLMENYFFLIMILFNRVFFCDFMWKIIELIVMRVEFYLINLIILIDWFEVFFFNFKMKWLIYLMKLLYFNVLRIRIEN